MIMPNPLRVQATLSGSTGRAPKITKPMSNARRIRAYARDNGQTGRFRPTPAQRRRINKHHRREWEF